MKISRKKHNQLFPKRKLKFYKKAMYEYDEQKDVLEIKYGVRMWVKILICITFPLILIIVSILQSKQYIMDLMTILDDSLFKGAGDTVGKFKKEMMSNEKLCE